MDNFIAEVLWFNPDAKFGVVKAKDKMFKIKTTKINLLSGMEVFVSINLDCPEFVKVENENVFINSSN